MAFIQTTAPEDSRGPLRRLYDAALKRAGYIAQVLRLMSIKPKTLESSMNLYIDTVHGPSKLSRGQREMIAVVVSRANDCYY
jgi:alkylhydroperoxidase family enzyme